MAKTPKHIAKKLNECLDDTGAPSQMRERAIVLSKLIGVTKQQARSLLEGQIMPDQALLDIIAKEFDIDFD